MNVISLNIWGGRAGKEGLLKFFEDHRDTTDIFCLQEVWSDRFTVFEGRLAGGVPINNEGIMVHALQEIAATLPDHIPYFRTRLLDDYGLCMFVRNSLEVIEEGDIFVHLFKGYVPPEGEDIGRHAANLQYVTINDQNGPVTVLNFHGLWNGLGKGDSEERLAQSDRIIEYINSLKNPSVVCGDFNLTPDTESIKKFDDAGLENLIKTYGVTSTRTSLYTKPGKFADYVFVSDGVTVNDFKVLPDEVSDHAPLFLDFSL
jgi:exonuclease III